ncbi:MAG TPA: TonB-dependent receptor [Cyclobacteriaceae bacterium]|nr:TonB-dependent receptor [Cyclobacteriaceae bacterium]
MKARLVFAFLSLFLIFSAHGQQLRYGIVTVTVYDAETGKPIPYANVYFNRTTIGGYTDANGKAEITRIPFGKQELVISTIGYRPYTRMIDITEGTTLSISVKLNVRMLDAVEVKGKRDNKWKRQLARFEKLFFGTHNKFCQIKNPYGLNFDQSNGEFTAEAREPLNIENDYLGYTLSFELKQFSYKRSNYVITGNVRFTEKRSRDSVTMARWKKNREETYRGSPQHFLKSVVDKNLTSEGFRVYTDLTTVKDIVRVANFRENLGVNINEASLDSAVLSLGTGGPYIIDIPTRLEVHYAYERAPTYVYRNFTDQISWVEVKEGQLGVNDNGIVQNPNDLVLSGTMSNMRVGEWLPFDYTYQNDNFVAPVIEPMVANVLLEAPYLHVDRPYYYNKEQIWFKGYMNYTVPSLRDTLSQMVYVDLVDTKGSIVTSKKYPIDSGRFHGDILLPDKLPTGNYQVKAYTQWMLNFDDNLIFTKTISLLGEKEGVRFPASLNTTADTTGLLVIQTDKDLYSTREKINLKIHVRDSLDFAMGADLSISVTDLTMAVPPAVEKTILTAFPKTNPRAQDSTASIKYNIQYGIGFNGNFFISKKPAQGIITVFQDSLTSTFGMITDEQGRFEKEIAFFDTIQFYIRSRNPQGKIGKVVMDEQAPLPVPSFEVETLPLDVYAMDKTYSSRFGTGARMLEEVVIKSKKIVKREEPTSPPGGVSGDFVLTGNWLEEHNVIDLPFGIAQKIPGARVFYADGIPVFTMKTGVSTGDLLILVDGVPDTDPNATAYDKLSRIPVGSIERVDITKYGMSALYGARGGGGIIAVYTKKSAGTEDPKKFDKRGLQAVRWGGYATASEFKSPDYSKPDPENYFDYRTTIYWNPNVATDGKTPATVSFYAADAPTKYRIVVEGIASDGSPIRGERIISIDKGR